jgi:hypothetical protein
MTESQLFLKELIDESILELNAETTRRFCARLDSECPPCATRHLTDTRTRVSGLLETLLGLQMDRIIRTRKEGWSVSAVLWNVFPDLRVRDVRHAPAFGLEVKAIHTAAEEKAANLSTPLNVIAKDSDFLVIMIWTWMRDPGNQTVFPQVLHTGVFDAYHLARARDYGWMAGNQGRIKGIDLATPVLNEGGSIPLKVKAEENNMGKLMRIGTEEVVLGQVPNGNETLDEIHDYERFQEMVLIYGVIETFKELCMEASWEIGNVPERNAFPVQLAHLATARADNGRIHLAAGRVSGTALDRLHAEVEIRSGDHILWFGQKLDWKVYKGRERTPVASGPKAESSYVKIIQECLG